MQPYQKNGINIRRVEEYNGRRRIKGVVSYHYDKEAKDAFDMTANPPPKSPAESMLDGN